MAPHDLGGCRFGRLVALQVGTPGGINRKRRWLCRCDCGLQVEVQTQSLRNGNTRSCGCLASEVKSAAAYKAQFEHGLSRTPGYHVWMNMVRRCHRPGTVSYERYGGRGIQVCSRWRESFLNFISDMGQPPPKMQIERINNDLGYQPGNCRWATTKEQASNKRNNRRITFGERTLTLAQWSEATGINYGTLKSRLNSGWPPAKAIGQAVA